MQTAKQKNRLNLFQELKENSIKAFQATETSGEEQRENKKRNISSMKQFKHS